MSILSVLEVWNGRDGSIDQRGVRTYTRKFQVIVDDPTMGPLAVTNSLLLPSLFASYLGVNGEYDLGATCRHIDPVQDAQDPFKWIVTYQYSSERLPFRFGDNPLSKLQSPGTSQGDSSEANPLVRPAEVNWTSAKFQKVLKLDVNNNAIANSAGVGYDPPSQRDDTRSVLTIKRNEIIYDPNQPGQFVDYVNSQPWVLAFLDGTVITVPAGNAKCETIDGSSAVEMGVFYWRKTYVFHIRQPPPGAPANSAWFDFRLDEGLQQLDANSKLVNIYDTFSVPVSSPVPLDGTGHQLANGQPVHYRAFQVYPTTDFNNLAVP
jgi:hypothetical protein